MTLTLVYSTDEPEVDKPRPVANKHRVERWYASDGTRGFLWESYVLEGRHRARLSVIGSHADDWAVGIGEDAIEALHAAWAAYQEKFPCP